MFTPGRLWSPCSQKQANPKGKVRKHRRQWMICRLSRRPISILTTKQPWVRYKCSSYPRNLVDLSKRFKSVNLTCTLKRTVKFHTCNIYEYELCFYTRVHCVYFCYHQAPTRYSCLIFNILHPFCTGVVPTVGMHSVSSKKDHWWATHECDELNWVGHSGKWWQTVIMYVHSKGQNWL